jgi:hypothetical protein
MGERKNPHLCACEKNISRITAYGSHEWLHDTIKVQHDKVALLKWIEYKHRYL